MYTSGAAVTPQATAAGATDVVRRCRRDLRLSPGRPPGTNAFPAKLRYRPAVREFNTEGPLSLDGTTCIPPLERVDLDEILGLIRSRRCFVLHAPRQTGKTSTLLALRDLPNSRTKEGFRCAGRERRDRPDGAKTSEPDGM